MLRTTQQGDTVPPRAPNATGQLATDIAIKESELAELYLKLGKTPEEILKETRKVAAALKLGPKQYIETLDGLIQRAKRRQPSSEGPPSAAAQSTAQPLSQAEDLAVPPELPSREAKESLPFEPHWTRLAGWRGRVWLITIGAVIVGMLAGVGMYHARRLERERRAEREQKQRINDAISGAATAYNADTSWWEKEIFYTVQAQDALIRMDKRPVLILGIIDDISKDDNGGYSLSITNSQGRNRVGLF